MTKEIQMAMAQAAAKELVPAQVTKRDELLKSALAQVGKTEETGGKISMVLHLCFVAI